MSWLYANFVAFGMWYTEWVLFLLAWGWWCFGGASKAVCAWLIACWWRRGCSDGTNPGGV